MVYIRDYNSHNNYVRGKRNKTETEMESRKRRANIETSESEMTKHDKTKVAKRTTMC
jgi:hypothetical protein